MASCLSSDSKLFALRERDEVARLARKKTAQVGDEKEEENDQEEEEEVRCIIKWPSFVPEALASV